MKRFYGIILVIISAASFGTLAIFGKFAYANGLDVTTLLFLRFTFAAVLMFLFMKVRKIPLPRGKSLFQLIGMGALGYVGQSFCFMSAIRFASTGLVALLLYTYPVMVSLFSVLFLKMKMTPRKVLALILATLGAALTANPQGGALPGILLAISAAFIYSLYIITGTGVMQKVSAVQSSAVIFAGAGLVFGLLTLINGAHWPQNEIGWLAVIAITFLSTIIPVATFLGGLKLIGPINASLFSTLEPVVTVILAWLILGEKIIPMMLIGGVLILSAVVLTVLASRESKNPEGEKPNLSTS